jgi:hypothetical protein
MDAKSVINLGLAKLGTSINSISPPSTSLEKHCAAGYPQWKASELTKRRWVFATQYISLNLNITATVTVDRPYAFDIPPTVLRLVRPKAALWEQNGKTILSESATLDIKAVVDVLENECPALFIDALALRVSMECVEKVTESNVKFTTLERWYGNAIRAAGQNNAIIIGPEENSEPDEIDPWAAARAGIGV